MKYLIAPSAYKGFFSPLQVAYAIADGIKKSSPDNIILLAPIADGGDGTIEALQVATCSEIHELEVKGALGAPARALWLSLERTKSETFSNNANSIQKPRSASLTPTNSNNDMPLSVCVLELASACGLANLEVDGLNALDANTEGVGQLIAHCYKQGYRNIVLAVGGSASTDGGTGILTALGAKLLSADGIVLQPGGRWLHAIHSVDLSGLDYYSDLKLRVATDVTNPLLGDQGAAKIFSAQKGASPDEVELLEEGMSKFADVLERTTGRSAKSIEGSGAAGGVPFGLHLALNADIIPGFQWISSLVNLEEKVKQSDIVISGEGSLDRQSISGKATGELARLCKKHEKHFWVIAGRIEDGIDWDLLGVDHAIAAATPGNFATLTDVSQATFAISSALER